MFLFSTQNRIYIYYFGINLVAFSHLCRICRVRMCLCIRIRPGQGIPEFPPHVAIGTSTVLGHYGCCVVGKQKTDPQVQVNGQMSAPDVSFLPGESAKYMACVSFVIVREMKCT